MLHLFPLELKKNNPCEPIFLFAHFAIAKSLFFPTTSMGFVLVEATITMCCSEDSLWQLDGKLLLRG